MPTLRLNIDPTGAVYGGAKVEDALSSVGAAANKAEVATGKVSGGMTEVGKTTAVAGTKMKTAAAGAGQLAVSLARGGSSAAEMATQGARLGSAFGLVGLAIGGLVAGGLSQLFNMLMAGTKDVKSFDDALSSANKSLSALSDTAAIFSSQGLVDLKTKYGEVNAELLEFVEISRQIAIRQAMEDASAAIASLRGELGNFFTDASADLDEMFNTGWTGAQRMINAMKAAESATTFEESLAAMTRLRELIIDASGGIDNMDAEAFAFFTQVKNAEDALRQLNAEGARASGWLGAMIGGAESLASKLWDAVSAAAAIAAAESAASVLPDERGSQRTTTIGYRPPPVVRGVSGSGSAARDLGEEYRSLRASLDEVYSATKEYEKAESLLNEALRQGKITQSEFNETLALAKSRMEEATIGATDMQSVFDTMSSSIEDAFMSMIDGTSSAKDAFRKMASEIIKELFRVLVVQRLVGSFSTTTGTGTGIVGMLGGLLSGARADGGSVSRGESYLVGEKGPEIFSPSRSGVITPNSDIGGGGGITQNIYVTTGVAQTVRSELIGLLPQIEKMAIKSVADARQRNVRGI